MSLSLPQYQSLTSDYGVYLFLDSQGKIIYVGKAINLRKRVSSYFQDKNLGEKTKQLVSQISSIKTISVTSEVEAFLLEERLIKKHHPRFNISLKDAKTYPYVAINIKEKYPSIVLTRKKDDDKALYFGPYTSVNSLRIVLKILRKIFPYVAVKNHPNYLCLYNHLGLCPCPNVTKDLNYKKNIRYVVSFLEGKTTKILSDLARERESYSKKQAFEKANEIQIKIDAINLITSPFFRPFEYEFNPNLKSDIIKKGLGDLKQILNENAVAVESLERIECFDISNISGKSATASMVVFKNGEKDGSSYRRFKIRGFYNNKANDFAMIREVVSRRLRHDEWPTPGLIVIDGGKGQVSSAKKVLSEHEFNIPIIGLAKREEIIIKEDLKEIKLPKGSPSLQLIMRLRDEAHRFAITYHRKLRGKLIYD